MTVNLMHRRKLKSAGRPLNRFFAGTLAVLSSMQPLFASEPPRPTFLESGDNDLIRFQMGGVPDVEDTESRALTFQESTPRPALSQTRERSASQRAVPAEPDEESVAKRASEAAGTVAHAPGITLKGPLRDQEAIGERALPAPEEKPDATGQKRQPLETTRRLFNNSTPNAAESDTSSDMSLGTAAPAAVAPVDAIAPPPVLPDAISSRLVAVCLNNPEDASGAKAFDIRREGPPRYVADIGATACARFEPTRHTLYLWKTNDLGALSLILSNRLDLNGEDGTQVTLDWLRDK